MRNWEDDTKTIASLCANGYLTEEQMKGCDFLCKFTEKMREPNITFEFEGKRYKTGLDAYNKGYIKLPDGRILVATGGWLESFPPIPVRLAEIEFVPQVIDTEDAVEDYQYSLEEAPKELKVGDKITIRIEATIEDVSNSHGLCYKVSLDQRDYTQPRTLWIEADEIDEA